MFSNQLQVVMKRTQKMAYDNNISEYTIEMLINEILKETNVISFFNEKNISALNMQQDFERSVLQFINTDGENVEEPSPDDLVVNIISRASMDLKKSNSQDVGEIGVFNILCSTTMSDKTEAYEILSAWGITRSMIVEKINEENQNNEEIQEDISQRQQNSFGSRTEQFGSQNEQQDNEISSFITNLNEQAKKGKLNPMIGRSEEIHRISTILARKTKSNPVITGEPGVGKTAIVEGLAIQIVNGESVEELKDKVIYNLNIGALLSGTKYRGDFEKRLIKIIEEMKTTNSIVFIDEIHTILGAGGASGSVDMANLLKPHLTSGDLTIIGATTNDEYTQIFEKNGALSRRFNEVKIKELKKEETVVLLERIKGQFEKHHNVTYETTVMEKIVELTNRYINDRHFPDKAIDFLDQVSAEVRLDKSRDPVVTDFDVNKLMSKISGVPLDNMENKEEHKEIIDLSTSIKEKVFGQDKAVDEVAEAMMLSYAGLKEESSPIGSFLCLGPTGVGKTELAKVLADKLAMPLVRFDMSEYMDQTSSNKLLGASSGYIGYEEGGLLRKALRDKPYSVILFDEYEKAHESINNLFLQILDEGEIKDAQGRLIDFKNTIIMFTSNAGVIKAENDGRKIGFSSDHENQSGIDMKVIKSTFPPEFRNRLSGVLEFGKLTEKSILSISNRLLEELSETLLMNKGISIKFTEEVSEFIGKKGFDPLMGARPIKRKITEMVSKELAKIILLKSLKEGSKISITMNKDKSALSFRTTKAK